MRSVGETLGMKFELSFTNKEITPWGRMVFLKQILDKMSLREQMSSCGVLPVQNSNRAYRVEVILESFITSIWCAANRFLHIEITQADRDLGKIFDWKQAPAQDVYTRHLGKFTQNRNQQVGHHFFGWFFKNLQLNYFTLDIDSSIITQYENKKAPREGTIRINKEETVILPLSILSTM